MVSKNTACRNIHHKGKLTLDFVITIENEEVYNKQLEETSVQSLPAIIRVENVEVDNVHQKDPIREQLPRKLLDGTDLFIALIIVFDEFPLGALREMKGKQ